ncbi:MAG: carbohydrate-binding family 9-like protein [Sphingobacteriales bacterium]
MKLIYNYKLSCVRTRSSHEKFPYCLRDDGNYYNLEFNPISTALIAYGSDDNNRETLDATIISEIKSQHTITALPNDKGNIGWELTLIIPFTLFIHNTIRPLCGKHCQANFFKCGDDLPAPHFLSWNPVGHPQPNFHLPRFFGKIMFR